MQNIANAWFQKSRVSGSSRVFAQSLGLATSMSRLGLKDFGRDSSSADDLEVLHKVMLKYIPKRIGFSYKQYLNCRGDASPHRDLASPNRDLASPPIEI